MRASILVITVLVAVATAAQTRDVQESATIAANPSVVALLRTINFVTALTACGGVILNNRSVLSAARCFQSDGPERWRFRVGSTEWNSGGTVYQASTLVLHEDWDEWAMQTDIAIVQTDAEIVESANVRPGVFGAFPVPANSPIRVVGWGYNEMPLWNPTQYDSLRQIQLINYDLDECRPHYQAQGFGLTANQLCIGFNSWVEDIDPSNRCFGEPGMPVIFGDFIVGIRSYTVGCRYSPEIPTINTRIGGFTEWIQANA